MTRGSSFAGFTYQKKLRTGFYGQVFRACSPAGAVVDVLHVDARIAGTPGFADALIASGSALAVLDEPLVVGTGTVGATVDGTLVVVTESEPVSVTVEELLRCAPLGLPHAVAASIGYEIISGLTSLHHSGIIDGAVHPRSVIVQIDGTVRLRDVAVGRALVQAGSRGELVRAGFGGYLAPEVAMGQTPTPAADVYGAAAVLYAMLSGSMPPGTLGAGPGFERMIQGALDADSSRRYPTAAELLANLAEALEDAGWARASEEELAGYVMDQQPKVVALHSAGGGADGAPAARQSAARSGPVSMAAPAAPAGGRADDGRDGDIELATQELISLLGGDGGAPAGNQGQAAPGGSMGPPPTRRAPETEPLPGAAAPRLASGGWSAGTPADSPGRQAEIAALQAVESLADERWPSQGAPLATAPQAAPRGEFAAQPVSPGGSRAVPSAAAVEPVAHAASAPQMTVSDADLAAMELGPSRARQRMGRWLWLLVIAGAIGALVWVVNNQRELREQAELRRTEQQAANESALAAFQASQPTNGTIAIDSEPDQAAVWLLLGRTPVDSMQLGTAALHELRVEFEGYQPQDLRVDGSTWTGDGDVRYATVKAKLGPRKPKQAVPAYPPEPPASARQGLRQGRGYIHVESEPPGAQVWLLVGFTPAVEVAGIAGERYELKVQKDGYLPGFMVIEASDWSSGGQGNRVSRSVALARDPGRRK